MLLPACSSQTNHYVFINISFSCEDSWREASLKANCSSSHEREITKGSFVVNPILKNNPMQVDLATNATALVNTNYPIKGIKGRNFN